MTSLSPWTLQVALLIALGLDSDFSVGADSLFRKRRRGASLQADTTFQQVQDPLRTDFLNAGVDELSKRGMLENWPLGVTVRRTVDERMG